MKAFFTILVVLLSGCNKFVLSSYSKKDIFTKYKEGYSTILNNSPIDIETIFLSEDNIDKIETNYKKKLIKIHQIDTTALINLSYFINDSLKNDWSFRNYNIKNVRLNIKSIPIDDWQKYLFETNAIESLSVITEKAWNQNAENSIIGDLLILHLKEW